MPNIYAKEAFATFPLGFADTATDKGRGVANVLGATGAGTSFVIPEYWKGRFLRVKAKRSAFRVSVSVGAKTLVFAQASPPTAIVDTAGYPIDDGETLADGIVSKSATHFNYVAEGTGDLFFTVTEPTNATNDGAESIA